MALLSNPQTLFTLHPLFHPGLIFGQGLNADPALHLAVLPPWFPSSGTVAQSLSVSFTALT